MKYIPSDPEQAANVLYERWRKGELEEVVDILLTLPVAVFGYLCAICAGDISEDVLIGMVEARTAGFQIVTPQKPYPSTAEEKTALAILRRQIRREKKSGS